VPARIRPPAQATVTDPASSPPPGRTTGERTSDQAARESVRALARAARVLERASADLSMAHYRVLSSVAAGQDRASRVAEQLGLGRPTVSAAVDALCRDGLLTRADVEADQRAVSLRLTSTGAQVLEGVEGEMVRRLDDLCDRTPDPAQVRQVLVWLGTALDERQAERLTRRRESGQ
jgi:DNA-binding MarR family transcriptional regulator